MDKHMMIINGMMGYYREKKIAKRLHLNTLGSEKYIIK